MQIAVLTAFIIALTLVRYAPSTGGASAWLAAAVAAYLAGAGLLAAANAALFRRAPLNRDFPPAAAVRRHHAIMLIGQAWLVGGLAGLVLVGWGNWVMVGLGLGDMPLIGTLVIMAPFFAAIILVWVLDYPFHRVLRTRLALCRASIDGTGDDPGRTAPQCQAGGAAEAPTGGAGGLSGVWTLRQYLDYNIRHELLFIAVPLSLIVAAGDAIAIYLAPRLDPQYADAAVTVITAATSLLVFLIAPALIVRVWRTRPLGVGSLRDGIEALCASMNIRFRQILIWQSGSVVANAAVMGLVGRFRYLLMSDALLERADRRDIQAVFAHEAQHVKGHHIFYSMLFAVCAAGACTLAAQGLCRLLRLRESGIEDIAAIALLAGAWGWGFGWFSRRLERQCDVYAAWLMGQLEQQASGEPSGDGRITPQGAAIFAHALQTIAMINGISIVQRNWRHGSLAGRVEHVLWLGATGDSRDTIDQTVGRIKIALWVTAAIVTVIVIVQYWQGCAGCMR